MNVFLSKRLPAALFSLLSMALAGCGGGGGSGSNAGASSDSATSTAITGLAATGAALPNARVTGKCVAGATIIGTTGGNGTFSLPLSNSHVLPCMLEVASSTPDVTLYSFARTSGRVNITPLTDMVVANAFAGSPATAFSSYSELTGNVITANLQSAHAYVKTQLAAAGVGAPAIDLLTGTFVVGDAEDHILDALGAALATSRKTIDELRAHAAAGRSIAPITQDSPTSSDPVTPPVADSLTWKAAQSLAGDSGYIASTPELNSANRISWAWGSTGRLLRQTYVAGTGWTTTHTISDLPSEVDASNIRVASRGDWTVTAWTKTIAASVGEELWVKVDGPDGAGTTAARVSSGLWVKAANVSIVVGADGVTLFWSEYNQPHIVTGRLVSRRWTAQNGWSDIVEHESNGNVGSIRNVPLADGGAMLVYEIESTQGPRTNFNVWARRVDASGALGARAQINDENYGLATGWGVHLLAQGNDVVAAWLQEPINRGAFCVVSRLYRNGAWGDATCANGTARTLFQPRLIRGSGSTALLAWFGSDAVYTSTLNAGGAWGAPERAGVPAANESGTSLFNSAVCDNGAVGIVWHATNADSSEALYLRVRSAGGTWGNIHELGRYTAEQVEALRIGVDSSCNWTAAWSTHGSSDTLYARRLLASSTLQPVTVLAEGIVLPYTNINGYRMFLGPVSLVVEPAGPAILLWKQFGVMTSYRWRRLE